MKKPFVTGFRGQLNKAINIGRIRPEYRIRPDDFDEFVRERQTGRQDG